MIFLEPHARLVLVVHAILGAATVAVTTHLVVWLRRYSRGDFRRHDAVRWFAVTGLVLYGAQFVFGNLLYPVYKVRVRAEYLDLGTAVRADVQARLEAKNLVEKRLGLGESNPAARPSARHDRSGLARTFDIKEHLAALGLAAAIAACVLAWTWQPTRDGGGGAMLLIGLAVTTAACAWVSALVGLVVTSVRSVGGLS